MIEADGRLKCNQCGHLWVRRDPDNLPLICPLNTCKSLRWNRDTKSRKLGKRTPKEQPTPQLHPATPPQRAYINDAVMPWESSADAEPEPGPGPATTGPVYVRDEYTQVQPHRSYRR